ncbi:MAG: SapC family protein [Pseudomonadota bacterium]
MEQRTTFTLPGHGDGQELARQLSDELAQQGLSKAAIPLSVIQHRDDRVTPIDPGLRASQDALIRLTIGDVNPLANHLPMVIYRKHGVLELIGLNSSSADSALFADHKPICYRPYPLVASMSGCSDGPLTRDDDDSEIISHYAVISDPQYLSVYGDKLFSAGKPTDYLKRLVTHHEVAMDQLRRTRQLLALLNKAGALTPVTIYHQGTPLACYLINDQALGDQLHKAADDPNDIYQAIAMACDIATSQEGLPLTTCTA